MQIDFTPIGAHRVLQTPMHLLAHRATELSNLLGSVANRLVERLFEAPDWRSRFTILDEYLLAKIRAAPTVSREIQWAWQQLTISNGMTPISKISGNLSGLGSGWSGRFAIVSAFLLRRSVGFFDSNTRLRSLVPRNANASLIAVECGYSDQAHMIREFGALSGSTPIELVRCYSTDGGIVEA